MRITFAQGCYPRKAGGGHRIVYLYANNLAAKGHKVTVVHPHIHWSDRSKANIYRRLRQMAGIAYKMLFPPRFEWQPIDKRVEMRFVPRLKAEYFPDADAVFATYWATAIDVAALPPEKGEKFYLIQHYETWAGPKERVDETWRMPLHKVVISKWLFSLGQELGCDDLVHIPNAIDHSQFRILVPPSERPRRVAFLYSPLDWKGASEALQAIEMGKRRYPDLQTVFYGIGRRPSQIPGWIEYRQNPPRGELVEQVLNGSSIFLSASWSEGWPLGPAEAMACGCAVLTTNSLGVLDYCEHGVSALVSPPKEPQALGANLLLLLGDDNLRLRLANAGNERIRQFTWERSTSLMEEYICGRVRARGTRSFSAPSATNPTAVRPNG